MELTEAARGAVRARNPPAELGLGTLRLLQMASSDCEGAIEVRVVSTTSSEMGYRGVTPRAERPDAPGDSPAGVRARPRRRGDVIVVHNPTVHVPMGISLAQVPSLLFQFPPEPVGRPTIDVAPSSVSAGLLGEESPQVSPSIR